jgi:hypothetical protein
MVRIRKKRRIGGGGEKVRKYQRKLLRRQHQRKGLQKKHK